MVEAAAQSFEVPPMLSGIFQSLINHSVLLSLEKRILSSSFFFIRLITTLVRIYYLFQGAPDGVRPVRPHGQRSNYLEGTQ